MNQLPLQIKTLVEVSLVSYPANSNWPSTFVKTISLFKYIMNSKWKMLKYDFIFHPPPQIKQIFILFCFPYTENRDFKNCFYMLTNGHVGFEFLAAWNPENLKFKVNLDLLLREILFILCTIVCTITVQNK